MIDQTVDVITDERQLSRTVWRFCYLSKGAVLDAYRKETRKTSRHQFRATQFEGTVWSRMDQRDNRIDRPQVPECVKANALSMFADSLKMADGE